MIYEKYIRNLFSRLTNAQKTSRGCSSRLPATCSDIRAYLFGHLIPSIIIKLRYVLVVVLLIVGLLGKTISRWVISIDISLGLVGVFYYPKLQVPSTQKVKFFLEDNPMEIYEFTTKNDFNGYSKEEKRMLAYPSVSFIFGIRDIDDGYVFDLNDRGQLHLMPIYLERRETLEFFKNFITHLGTRTDLFASKYDLEKDFEAFYQVDQRCPLFSLIFTSFLVLLS